MFTRTFFHPYSSHFCPQRWRLAAMPTNSVAFATLVRTFMSGSASKSFSVSAGNCTIAMKDVAPDSFAIILAHITNPDQIGACIHTFQNIDTANRSTSKVKLRAKIEDRQPSYAGGALSPHRAHRTRRRLLEVPRIPCPRRLPTLSDVG